MSFSRKLKSFIFVTLSGYTTYSALSFYRSDESFYKNILMPAVHLLNPEQAHKLGILCSKYRLLPKSKFRDPDCLKVNLFNKEFSNPVGIAAGFDKNGEAILGLNDIGFGFIEIGSVTPEPQPGNDQPRVFRLSADLAVINRYGFNNVGHSEVYKRVEEVKSSKFNGIIGVNLGKNKTSPDAVNDYVEGVKKFGPIADYLVINISSPNTPGLRSMQNKNVLEHLLRSVNNAKNSLSTKPALLLKLAPDLSYEERRDIASIVQQKECSIDGFIISNTTIERPESLQSEHKTETGGLSGKPLKDMSTKMIADMRKLTNGRIPIIGVGGISSGEDAYEKIRAGAVLIQIYTSFVYEGPPIVSKIKAELSTLVSKDGFKNIMEAVGKDIK